MRKSTASVIPSSKFRSRVERGTVFMKAKSSDLDFILISPLFTENRDCGFFIHSEVSGKYLPMIFQKANIQGDVINSWNFTGKKGNTNIRVEITNQ